MTWYWNSYTKREREREWEREKGVYWPSDNKKLTYIYQELNNNNNNHNKKNKIKGIFYKFNWKWHKNYKNLIVVIIGMKSKRLDGRMNEWMNE